MRIVILIVLVVFGIAAVACTREAPSPADNQTASQPTPDIPATVEASILSTREAEAAIDATVEAKVAAASLTVTAQLGVTPAPINARATEPTPSALTLDEYLTFCAPTDLDLADDATYGYFSSELAAEADRFEALTPPAELSEWHSQYVEAYRTMQAILDTQPKDDVVSFASLILIAAASAELEEKSSEVVARLPEDVRQQMVEAGCIDPELVPDDNEYATDDHGDSEGDATAIRVGADVRGTLDYDGDIDYFRFQAERGQSYRIDVALGTLNDSIVNLFDSDGWFLDTNDDYEGAYASRLSWYAPSSGERYVAVEGYGLGSYTLTVSLIIDDHGNSEGDATAIRVGADVRGELEYDGDFDFFRFQAEAGRSYQIDVALGTLDNSVVDLYDTDGSILDTNDDYEGTYASRLYWVAPSSGERYVLVGGYGIGTYTLTVSLIIDDHGNSEGDATAIRVGADVRGELEYDGDFDFFRFQAEAGRSYQIDVALGTLDNSIVELYGAGGSFLDANDDYGNTYASRLSWRASSSGERYVFVGGYGIGTYTLTVSIIDDHGNDFESATRIAKGETVAFELEHEDDIDVLVIRARPGTEYVVTLDWEEYHLWDNPGSIMVIYDAGGRVLARLMGYHFYENGVTSIYLQWQAVNGGDYYIAIGDGNTIGSGAFYVTEA